MFVVLPLMISVVCISGSCVSSCFVGCTVVGSSGAGSEKHLISNDTKLKNVNEYFVLESAYSLNGRLW